MNESEQQILFKRVQKRFRHWSKRKCSGYVHGIVDEASVPAPQADMLDNQQDEYNVCYVYGFMDARGPDVVSEEWYKLHPVSGSFTGRDYRWWVKK